MEKKEIYIIEDSPDFRHLIRSIFNKFLPEYNIRFFQGASELYHFMVLQSSEDFTGRRPGLIIVDLGLSTIDGYELIKLIRATPSNQKTEWKTIPIVVLSSSTSQIDINKCYQAGINSYFTKPDDLEKLRRLLEIICHYWIDSNTLATPGLLTSSSKLTQG